MATEIFGPILPVQLDSRNINDMVRAIQSRMFIESEGALTDFTPASPLAAISEGQGFAQAELTYYMNTLPEAVTVQWLRTLGIQRKLGSRARVDITFYRVPGYSRPVTIPAGTKVYANGGQVYTLLEQVRMTEETATVTAQSERWGTVYNVSANEIARVERNFLGLDFVTNLQPAVGGEDLETIDSMKLRAFELFGRRNLTSRSDFQSEVQTIAPEAALVRVLPYSERFGENSRGVFVVAGGPDGSPLQPATQSLLLTSIRDRVPLDVKVYLDTPVILPIEIVVNILWNPQATTTFTDTIAAEINQLLVDTIDPVILGLGTPLSFTSISRRILALDYVIDIATLDIKERIVDPEVVGGTDRACGRFVGEELDDETCLLSYREVVDKTSQGELVPVSETAAYRLYRSVIALTSVIDSSTLTYTYDELYDIF
jgi:hypothetical protein